MNNCIQFNHLKTKAMIFIRTQNVPRKMTIRSKISETCIRASVTKKSYQPRTNILKDGKCDLVTDSHNILSRKRNYFSQLLNILG
jgi:hypothetical protein